MYPTLPKNLTTEILIVLGVGTPGAELPEIRHQASYSQFLETPPMLFALFKHTPHHRRNANIFACSSQNQPFQQHRTCQHQRMNGNMLKQTCKCNPFNSFITQKYNRYPFKSCSWACLTNTPLGVKKVTTLVPMIFESNPWGWHLAKYLSVSYLQMGKALNAINIWHF